MAVTSKILLQFPLVKVREIFEEEELRPVIECAATSPNAPETTRRLRFSASEWRALLKQMEIALSVIRVYLDGDPGIEVSARNDTGHEVAAVREAKPSERVEVRPPRRGAVVRKS